MKCANKVPFGPLGVMVAIGIVFGDIGTSPLYVMRAALLSLPDGMMSYPDYIIGIVSCVIWTLTIQTTLKYVVITLRADNKGEGGILALYALIRKKYRWAYLIAAMGAATLLADGVITPAITIISAVEGINTIAPSVPVVPVTVLIVLIIFMVQPFGTSSLGKLFGAFMILWFAMMGLTGLFRLTDDLSVLRAFNPYYAIHFLATFPQALLILGAVFLCTTGAEALYSDLGHCGLKNIRVSWVLVKIALVLNYLGQAAWIVNNPTLVVHDVNPFFAMMPNWFSMVGVIMATFAAIIASQALISGSFTIISEAISLNIWPNVRIKYPTHIKGQMYIPSVNHSLMALCIIVIVTMKSSMRLEAAYGLAITLSMMMTSLLLFLYLLKTRKPLWFSIPITLFFVTIESVFFLANLQKFQHGGFIPIVIAAVLMVIMYSWYNGRRIKRKLSTYDIVDKKYTTLVNNISNDQTIPKVATHLVYIVKANRKNNVESKITYSLFKKTPKRADTYWFVHIIRSDDPYEFAHETTVFIPHKFFRIDIRAGFKQGIHVDKYVHLITSELECQGMVDLSSRYPSLQNSGYQGDFTFMVVDRFFRNITLSFKNQAILNIYNLIKKITTSDVQMYDLDPAVAVTEIIPVKQPDFEHEKSKMNQNTET